MRNTRWLRYAFGLIVVAGTGLVLGLTACSDDQAATPAQTDTGAPDAELDVATDVKDAAPKPILAKLTFVNATTDMGPSSALNVRGDSAIRVCFKQGTPGGTLSVAGYPPLPDKPKGTQTFAGIFPGTGGTFPSFGLDLEGRILVPYVMNVKTLLQKGVKNPGTGQPGITCDELVGAAADAAFGLVENADYWILPQIDAGSFKKEKSYVLALVGCVGDATIANKDKCGANPPTGLTPGVGNLKVHILETNTTPVSATQLGVQFFHVATATNTVFAGGTIPFSPGFMSNPLDAATYKPAVAAPIVLNTITPAQGVTGVVDSNYFVLDKANPSAPDAGALAPFPLPLIQLLSGLTDGGLPLGVAPTIYKDGKNFVFVAVGDVQQPTFNATDGGGPGDGGDGTSFNTKSFHFLAFPTDPVIEDYAP